MLYRSFATVGGLTFVSRVLGFFRDALIAAGLGSGPISDAFFLAFRFPNLFRRLFGEGAFNAAFVPLFAKRLEKEGRGQATLFAQEILSVLVAALFVFSIVVIILMPWLMLILAPGFVSDIFKYDLVVDLTQIMFPYLGCMSLVALLSGVLNSLNRYWVAASAPIILNIILTGAMASTIFLGYQGHPISGYVLSAGVLFAGFVQLLMLWIAVRRSHIILRLFAWPHYTPSVKKLIKLGIPGIVSGGITQINIVVGTVIASSQAGAVSFLYYADRLYQLPLGIIGVAVGVVLLPELSRRLREGDIAAVFRSQNRSMEFSLLLTLPAAVALFMLAEPIIIVLFERGAFSRSDTIYTAGALRAFAIGLPAFVLIKVFQPGFFAREDTITPMKYAGASAGVNIALSLALFGIFTQLGWMPHVGIAFATSVAGWMNAALLFRELFMRGNFQCDNVLKWNVSIMFFSSTVMGFGLWGFSSRMVWVFSPLSHTLSQFGGLIFLIVFGLVVYGILLMMTGVLTTQQLKELVGRGN